MKTTKAQQQDTRSRIVRAAVALFAAQGYDAVTMKDIARAAGIGDATVYKYFATKDRLLLGFFDEAAAQALAATRAAPGFQDYELQSRLQRLCDALLEVLAPDRAVVQIARQLLLRAPLLMLGEHLQAKQLLQAELQAWLDEAVARGELPPTDHARAMSGLIADALFGVVGLWLRDDSPDHADTTRLVDQALALLVATLKAGLPDRLVQLAGFALRSQLARVLGAWGTVAAAAQRPDGRDSQPSAARPDSRHSADGSAGADSPDKPGPRRTRRSRAEG